MSIERFAEKFYTEFNRGHIVPKWSELSEEDQFRYLDSTKAAMSRARIGTVSLETQLAFQRWVADVAHRHNLSSPDRGITPQFIAMALAVDPGFDLFVNGCGQPQTPTPERIKAAFWSAANGVFEDEAVDGFEQPYMDEESDTVDGRLPDVLWEYMADRWSS